jgi:AraC family transcriptional activator of mtrCDE
MSFWSDWEGVWRLQKAQKGPESCSALFAVALRLASEVTAPPDGLLALAGNPRLVPALTALFNEPARAWTLPELAQRCNMSRATFIRHFQERLGRSASA